MQIYSNYLAKNDWVLLTTDDSYVIMENLRHFLSELNTSLPLCAGRIDTSDFFVYRNLKTKKRFSFTHVFSKEAIKELNNTSTDHWNSCRKSSVRGDLYQDLCMDSLRIKSVSGKDKYGLERLNIVNPELWGLHVSYRELQFKEPVSNYCLFYYRISLSTPVFDCFI